MACRALLLTTAEQTMMVSRRWGSHRLSDGVIRAVRLVGCRIDKNVSLCRRTQVRFGSTPGSLDQVPSGLKDSISKIRTIMND